LPWRCPLEATCPVASLLFIELFSSGFFMLLLLGVVISPPDHGQELEPGISR
jgi:hypothetical protein